MFNLYPHGIFSREDFTDRERDEYLAEHLGTDDGNERERNRPSVRRD